MTPGIGRKRDTMIKAIIFDIDGTLVDLVDLHAKAWQEALAHFGHGVAFADVRAQIGKGGAISSCQSLSRRRNSIVAQRRSRLTAVTCSKRDICLRSAPFPL